MKLATKFCMACRNVLLYGRCMHAYVCVCACVCACVRACVCDISSMSMYKKYMDTISSIIIYVIVVSSLGVPQQP